MEEEEYKDAARIYSEMIVLGDSLFRVYTGERVEDMRKDYTIDELELQNSAQQKRLYNSLLSSSYPLPFFYWVVFSI